LLHLFGEPSEQTLKALVFTSHYISQPASASFQKMGLFIQIIQGLILDGIG
jgi:hypothetical protein